MDLVKSTSHDQGEILRWILHLRNLDRFDVDLTYGRGQFYREGVPEPFLKFDKTPKRPGVIPSDSREMPLRSGSIRSMVFDPPFLATKGPTLQNRDGGNLMVGRFGHYPTEKDLFDFYWDTLRECFRVLRTGGTMVFKCQDKVSGGRQYWSHVLIANEAERIGFYLKDLFVLLAKSRLVAKWQRNQQHARKYHCYFLVLEKVTPKRITFSNA